MEYDLDAISPKGVVDEKSRREILGLLLSNTRRTLTKQLRWSIFWTLFIAAFLAYALWYLFEAGGNPWFWGILSVWQGSLLILWAFIWSTFLRERDKVNEALKSIDAEESGV